jgi:integrase
LVKREAFSKLNWEAVIFFSEHYRAKAKPGQSTAARVLTALEIEHLLQACIEYDEATFSMTRAEKVNGEKGSTLRNEPIGPFVAFMLLTGMRPDIEALKVEWKHVDFDRNVIHVGQGTKTGKTRDVTLDESPMLRRLLDAQWELTNGEGRVWPMSYAQAESARRRLKDEYDAPDDFKWYGLRKTCQSTLASSPSIYGAASIFLTAKRGGHSAAICEQVYADAIKLVDPDAKTIEGALGVEELLDQIAEDLEATEVAA